MTAAGVEIKRSDYGEVRVSEIDLGPWFAGPRDAAFSRAALLRDGTLELMNAGVLTSADIAAVSPELAALWNLEVR
jgi:hypothetical protein